MPALVAIRFNKDLNCRCDALDPAGKPSEVAITAVMRPLVTPA
jgi:transposase